MRADPRRSAAPSPRHPIARWTLLAALFAVGLSVGGSVGWSLTAGRGPEPTAASAAPHAPEPPPPETGPPEPPRPAVHAPADLDGEAEDCPDVEARCALRMHTAGCVPLPVPDDFEGTYDPASVEAWAEDLRASCPRFRDEVLQVDCADYPCLLVVRSVTQAPAEGLEGLGLQTSDTELLDQLTCGVGEGAPELASFGEDLTAEPRTDFVAVWPESILNIETFHRIHNRKRTYDDARIDALLEEAGP